MSTAITRRPVIFYNVTKIKKINKDDEIVETFKSLSKARDRAGQLSRNGNFKSLKNNNGVSLPLSSKKLELKPTES